MGRPGAGFQKSCGQSGRPRVSGVRAALNTTMAKPIAIRRAAVYRQRALELSETAKQLRDEVDRKHLRDLAAIFQRAADAMALAPEATERDEAFGQMHMPENKRPTSLRHYRSRKSV